MNKFLFTMLALVLFSTLALAQSGNTGNLVGSVADASGTIAGAEVLVKDNQTGRERTVTTGDSGTFSVPQLDVGTYTITISAPGHKKFVATEVKIDVSRDYTLNAVLEVGEITENVTVVAGADIINASTGELSTTVSPRQIVELPLNGRNPLSLVLLQAGTSSNSAQNTTINGQRSSFTNITRDGINVQDNFIRANAVDFLPDRPNVDDTGEFTIITQNAGAEAGYGSSQVQLVTPRGSNEFHGAAFLYNRNSKFAANSFFNNFARVDRPFLNRNQFGGKVGGPLPLPRFGEGGPSTIGNKAFFFFAYEGFRLRQAGAANRTILLPNARQGMFTWRDTTGAVRTANIFTLAQGLSGNPATGIDPLIASRILANVPTSGNNPTLGDQLNTTGFSLVRQQNQDREAFTTRFDFDLSSTSTINAVYSYKKELNFRTDVDAQQGGIACCYSLVPFGFQDAHTKFLALAWRWSPGSAWTNELRGGWQRSDPTFGNKGEASDFFIQIPLINNPESQFQAQGRDTDIYNIQDNAVWVRGSHSFRFGGQFQAFRITPFGPGAFGAPTIPNYVIGGGTTPAFTVASFNAAAGCLPSGVNCINQTQVGTATNLLRLLGGHIGTANQTFTADNQTGPLAAVPPTRQLFYEHYSFYGADQWRASQSLTLNFGLRYELFTPIREPNGLALEPVIQSGDILSTILNPNGIYDFVGTNSGGTDFFKIDRNNFAPVVSFAWSPTFGNGFLNRLMPGEGRTVIRGGYRMSYVNDEFVRAADNALGGNAGLTQGLAASGNFRLNALPSFTPPPLQVPRTYAQNNALALNFGTVFAVDPDIKVPRTQEFNIGIEREIGWQTAFEVRFVHGQSDNLVRGLDFNQVRIFGNGFLEDAERARQNRALGLAANCSAATPGCQPLQLLNQAPFNTSVFGNPLAFSNTLIPIDAGDVGQLAFVYLATFRTGSSVLLNNPNTGVADLLGNGAKFRYNALQTEIRRRFSQGLTFQANYTFQKSLTDAPGTGQTRFEPLIDNALGSRIEYAIADTDTTHVFNLNAIYELPFGRGRRFFSGAGGLADRIIGGWQLTSIFRIDSGAPFSITDPRGTLNRTGRSGRQTANTNLTKDQIKNLVGVFRTPCGIFFIDPQVINLDLAQCGSGLIRPRQPGTTAGVAALGFGQGTFPGQVFFNVPPGQTGNLERNFISSPTFLNWDASIIKNIPITERVRFQIRGEAFNVLNRSNFAITNQFTQANINSGTFGRLLSTFQPRIVQFVGRIEF